MFENILDSTLSAIARTLYYTALSLVPSIVIFFFGAAFWYNPEIKNIETTFSLLVFYYLVFGIAFFLAWIKTGYETADSILFEFSSDNKWVLFLSHSYLYLVFISTLIGFINPYFSLLFVLSVLYGAGTRITSHSFFKVITI